MEETTAIKEFMADCSLEVTPNGLAKLENLEDIFTKNQRVYVTFLPGSDSKDTIIACERLKQEGYAPIPHIAARSVQSEAMLNQLLEGFSALSIDQALLIAGGVDQPLGPYHSSLDILKLGLFEQYGFRKIGLAGHPEGSPDIPEPEILQALRDKNAYAADSSIEFYLVTQFCFEAEPIIAWDRHIRAEANNRLPIHIGIPGLATLKTLLKHAQACGIGASMRVLTRQAGNLAKLLVVNEPDKLTRDLANYRANDPQCGITGCHLYPLGGVKKSADWLINVQAGNFELGAKNGFTIQ